MSAENARPHVPDPTAVTEAEVRAALQQVLKRLAGAIAEAMQRQPDAPSDEEVTGNCTGEVEGPCCVRPLGPLAFKLRDAVVRLLGVGSATCLNLFGHLPRVAGNCSAVAHL
jgi:hypothetical protein